MSVKKSQPIQFCKHHYRHRAVKIITKILIRHCDEHCLRGLLRRLLELRP